MILDRRRLMHGILALPATTLLAHRPLKRADAAVQSGAELQEALRRAGPGDEITLAPGDFGEVDQFELSAPGATLRADVPLRSVLRAPLVVTGEGAKVLDLAFEGEGADGIYMSAVDRCTDSLSITSAGVEVRGCDFGYFQGRAIIVRPSGLRPYIHDCSFHDPRNGGDFGKNAHEGIALGYDNPNSNVSMRARVINNRFWNMNIEGEAISVKTSDNTLQGNQISSSVAGFTNRYGERNLFQDNTSTNSRGFAVGDRGCRLLGNHVNGRGSITILAGDTSASDTKNGRHPQAMDTYLEGNSGLLVIGGIYRPVPAANTSVRSHNGSVRLQLQTGTRLL
jgi:hypothetical protein